MNCAWLFFLMFQTLKECLKCFKTERNSVSFNSYNNYFAAASVLIV